MEKKLYRNEHDKMIAGVCSGLATYLQIDATVVRLLFVLTTMFIPGSGLLAYIILWVVVPVNNDPSVRFSKFNEYFQNTSRQDSMFNSPNAFSNPSNSGESTKWNTQNTGPNFTMPNSADFNNQPKRNDTGRTVAGLVILVLGIYFLAKEFFFIPVWFSIYKLWPLAIVAVGISLIFKNKRKNEWEQFKRETEEAQRTSSQNPVDVGAKSDQSDSTTPTV
ncbi:MAG: PspC domain-containing protein [Pedobacter sp.]|nr:MAG: PspC domain-containing protein [Pedobacter sp.]